MTKRENKSPSRSTKRALTSSVLALVLCFVMLLGTTFAWFTDTASTKVNKIEAGTLKVDLVDAVKNESIVGNDGLSWQKAEDATENEEVLWEPGVTYKTETFKVKNDGSLALKYQFQINGITGNAELLDVITFNVVDKDGNAVALDTFEGHLTAEATSDAYYIEATMDTMAGNDYQDKSLENLAITVYAAQDTVEYDSYTDQYDKDATYAGYPAGVTEADFNTNKAIAVDSNGKFYSTFKDALAAGGTLYLKENSTVPEYNEHPNVTKDITIYANGATFNNDISIGTYAKPESSTVNVTIYDAKNLTVWGEPKSNGTTWNVTMIGCENDGHGLVMYRSETGTDKINLLVRNCKVSNVSDGIHTTADGSITVEDSIFTETSAGINIAHKFAGDMTVTVKNCSFIQCGTTSTVNTQNEYCAPARFVNTGTGKLTVNLENNSYTDTIGNNGDVEIGDFRDGKTNKAVTLTSKGTYLLKCSTAAATEVTNASGTYHNG